MAEQSRPWTLRRLLREALILAVIFFVVSTLLNHFRAPRLESDTLPHIQATLIDGSRFDSDKLAGRPLLINFWGTWCPVCAQEAPNIDAVAAKYPVLTIAVNSRGPAQIRDWMQERGLTYPVLNDPGGQWAARFKVDIYPTTFIYDGQGKLRFTETGYSTTAGLLARMKLAE